MKKLGLLIDSTVYLDQEVIDQNNIEVCSLNVVKGRDSFKETEINNQWVHDNSSFTHHLTTSQPAPGEFLEAYTRMIEEGYERIFVVLLSKNISGTFQSATLAMNMLDDPSPIHIFDTSLAAYGTSMIALEVIKMLNDKKTEEEIIERIDYIISTSQQMFTVENLFSLVRGGRLKLSKAAIGTVLRVKPMVRVIEGKLELVTSERTHKKLNKYIINAMKESMEGHTKLSVYTINIDSDDNVEKLKQDVLAEFPDAVITGTNYIGPVFTIHVGNRGYGLSYFCEK